MNAPNTKKRASGREPNARQETKQNSTGGIAIATKIKPYNAQRAETLCRYLVWLGLQEPDRMLSADALYLIISNCVAADIPLDDYLNRFNLPIRQEPQPCPDLPLSKNPWEVGTALRGIGLFCTTWHLKARWWIDGAMQPACGQRFGRRIKNFESNTMLLGEHWRCGRCERLAERGKWPAARTE